MKTRTYDVAALLLRLAAGLIFLPHGWSKVFGSGGAAAFAQDMPSYGLPAFLGYVAAYAELFGALLLIAGLVSRLDAFLLACNMGVAIALVHGPDALHDVAPGTNVFFSVVRAVELPLALLAICVAIVVCGPGRFSLDSLLGVEARIGGLLPRRRAARLSSVDHLA